MTVMSLDVNGLRDPQDATLMRFPVKAAAVTALRPFNLGPDIAPVRAQARFGRSWMVWAVPAGDPGEARLLLTHQRLWVRLCAVGCVHIGPGRRYCPGHLMDAGQSLELTLAIAGHRTQVLTIGTVRKVEGVDWLTGRVFTDDVDAGILYRAVCLCGWRTGRLEQRGWASQQATRHRETTMNTRPTSMGA